MITCPVCKKESNILFKTKDRNRKISQKEFDYFNCPDCGIIFLSEVPKDLGLYYGTSYYEIPSYEKLKKVAAAEHFKIEMVKKFARSGTLLEIGPAFGVFAYQAKEAGFNVDTIEMDGECCKYLTSTVGVNAVKSDLPHKAIVDMKEHDVIAMWHVLEHLEDPWKCLEAAAGNLSEGGVLVIATPNPESFQLKMMGASWPHIDAPRHINLIPAKLLARSLERFGLKQVMVTTNDDGGKSWNRFGWQRYLMNNFPWKFAQIAFFLAGYLVSIPMALWDERGFNGCAYTAVFQKSGGPG